MGLQKVGVKHFALKNREIDQGSCNRVSRGQGIRIVGSECIIIGMIIWNTNKRNSYCPLQANLKNPIRINVGMDTYDLFELLDPLLQTLNNISLTLSMYYSPYRPLFSTGLSEVKLI